MHANSIKRGAGAVNQPQKNKMTWDFAFEELLGGTIEFLESQRHMTSKEAKPALAAKKKRFLTQKKQSLV